MPGLSTLPPEILLVIADHTPKDGDLSSLTRSSRRTNAILLDYFYRRAVRSGDPKGTIWKMIKTANVATVQYWIKAGGDVNTLVDGDSLLITLISARCFSRRYFDTLRNKAYRIFVEDMDQGKHEMETEKLRAQEEQRMKGYYAIAELLLDCGADIHATTAANQPLLHVAALAADEDMVRLLVAHGADVQSVTERGNTALHAAALAANTVPILQFLLDHGADVHLQAQTVDGITPLHGAVYLGSKESAACLLRNGTGSAYGYGYGYGYGYERGGSQRKRRETPVNGRNFLPHNDMQDLLEDHGVDPEAMGVCGRSRWACVAAGDTLAAIGCLVRNGADVNVNGPSAEILFQTARLWGVRIPCSSVFLGPFRVESCPSAFLILVACYRRDEM
ncbi:ankyrin repeat-containing domain protein [Aspergillus carlsbadensis]|nr:ankyrin repeat-containing domain protein [Aspergillus carlsbadensis]